MKDKNQTLSGAVPKPVVEHPGPLSMEDLLRFVDPVPDEETERFVAAIYLDRREASAIRPFGARET